MSHIQNRPLGVETGQYPLMHENASRTSPGACRSLCWAGRLSANAEPGAAVAGGPPVKKETDDRLSHRRHDSTMACIVNANQGWRVPRQPGARERFGTSLNRRHDPDI
jgi:hypothetical protein